MTVGVVVIGRNEGDRLRKCLESLRSAHLVVYVDSGSSDGSVELAKSLGAHVVELDQREAFTASRARNAGLIRLTELTDQLGYVQFVDGDCEIDQDWLADAAAFLRSRPDVGAACGRLMERHPDFSVYNWLCEQEWNGPIGEIGATGGNVMMRADALEQVGGYREDVIAAEDDEICVRLRGMGWKIWRLDAKMGLHDAAIARFNQWFRRMIRAGYAFAQGAYLHGATPEQHFVWESRRALILGVGLPLACVAAGLMLFPWGFLSFAVYPAQFAVKLLKLKGPLKDRATLAFFHLIARIPEGIGQLKFARDRLLDIQPRIIEYKERR